MHIGTFQVHAPSIQLIDSIEVVAALARSQGKEEDAVALFRLRIKIREGLPYNEAKALFDLHTKGLLTEKQ